MNTSRILIGLVFTASLCVPCVAQPPSVAERDKVPDSAPVRVSIHYLDGLSARSGSKPQRLVFNHNGCQLSLLLTNTTNKELHLWKPYCPQGDDAIRLEFRLDENSKQIGVARTSHLYTGGMGITKTMSLAPGDSLVYQIDLSSFWSLPFVLEPGAEQTFQARAVYESKPMDVKLRAILAAKSPAFVPPAVDEVWQGRVETDWEQVRIGNTTDSKVPKHHRGIKLLDTEGSGTTREGQGS